MSSSSKTLIVAMITAFILIKLTWAESSLQVVPVKTVKLTPFKKCSASEVKKF